MLMLKGGGTHTSSKFLQKTEMLLLLPADKQHLISMRLFQEELHKDMVMLQGLLLDFPSNRAIYLQLPGRISRLSRAPPHCWI